MLTSEAALPVWHYSNPMDTDLRFLEISLPSADVHASLEWYCALGFAELSTTDIRRWHYGVVTDGNICLGLHAEGIDQCGLCFVRPELAAYVLAAQDLGTEFESTQLGIEDFHEAMLRDPIGNCAVLVEARTFSPGAESTPAGIGQLAQLELPCMNVTESSAFWEGLGFIGVQSDGEDSAELHMPGLTMRLKNGVRDLTLHFRPDNLHQTLETLSLCGIEARTTAEGQELRAPEGTRLLLAD